MLVSGLLMMIAVFHVPIDIKFSSSALQSSVPQVSMVSTIYLLTTSFPSLR